MKKAIFLLIFFEFLLMSCRPGQKDAVKYHEHIMGIVNELTLSQNGFMMQINGHNIDSLKITQKQFSEHSKASLDEINRLEPFDEKTDFRDVAVEYVKTVNAIAGNEAKEMVEIMSKDSADLKEADIIKITDLSVKFDTDYEKAYASLEAAQAAFVKEWKFGIEKADEK